MKFRVLLIGVCFVLPLLWGPSIAQDDKKELKQSSDEPLDITSKKFTAKNVPNGLEATFEGGVKVRQGDMTLTCDKLTIDYDEDKTEPRQNHIKKGIRGLETAGKIRAITAVGNVKFVQGERIAVAGKALYDNSKRTITLTKGPPKLWQGPDVVVADTIIIYLDENRTELLGGDEAGIRATINPSKMKKEK
jgi:lipopolysaccharide export system protein LptA|uniref:Organic solvent tolerance-like N-terminal domain-containing protein n=1 Tax=Desulfomonile tiedjei TaxID=2358 RepID=A0A7C4ET32_9BACT